jgi:hypothetical protein
MLLRPGAHTDPVTTFTHRPLPDDPGLGALPAAERVAVAEVWRQRAGNELSTSAVFATLTRSLVATGAPHAILRQAAAAVEDEVRHAQICVHVALAYDPACAPPPPSVVSDPPRFTGSEEVDAGLFVVMQSCVNEGVAAAYLQRCLDEATSVLARAAVRDILTDEIHHARFGWTWLAAAGTASMRATVAEALPTLLRLVADAWMGDGDSPRPKTPLGHGIIDGVAVAQVVREAYEALILPGFEAAGIDSRPACAWVRRRWAPASHG